MMQLNRYAKQIFNGVKVQYRMCQYHTANTEHGNEKCKDQDQIGYLGSRSPMGETALAGEGEGVRSTFDQIIIEQVKTKHKRIRDKKGSRPAFGEAALAGGRGRDCRGTGASGRTEEGE